MEIKPATKTDTSITLLRAAFTEPFRIAMRLNGVTAETWFRKFRLPEESPADPEALIPEKPFWHLINRVAISEGIPDFGMQVARALPWYEIETMHPLLSGQPNLHSLLTTFCTIASNQSSIAKFALRVHEETCFFEHLSKPLVSNDIQMEIYHITSMIDLIQVCTGGDWRPHRIRLMMKRNRIVDLNQIFGGTDVIFSQPHSAIEIETKFLTTPLRKETGNRFEEYPDARNGRNLKNKIWPLDAIREILDTYVTEENLSIELVADIAGLSTRGVQRLIKSQGSNYRDLLGEARKNYAIRHLRSGETVIRNIANQLGYRNAAHFTRAFKRWTGITPSQFRDHRTTGVDQK